MTNTPKCKHCGSELSLSLKCGRKFKCGTFWISVVEFRSSKCYDRQIEELTRQRDMVRKVEREKAMTNTETAIKILEAWAQWKRGRWWEVFRSGPGDYSVAIGDRSTLEELERDGTDILAAASEAIEAWSPKRGTL